MPRPEHYTALIVVLVALSGCIGNLPSASAPPSPSNWVESPSDTPTTEESQPIAVVNNRSTPYRVTFQVVRGPIPAVNLTYENGSVQTKPVANPQTFTLPFLGLKNVTDVELVNTSEVAQWSAIVQPESTVTLPLPIDRHNVTLLAVVKTQTAGESRVVKAQPAWCGPSNAELVEFHLHLQEGRNNFRGGSSCG